MERYLEGTPIYGDAKTLRKYIGQQIMSVHKVDIDSRRGCARPRIIIIEEVQGKNLLLADGDVTWIPDYREFAEMESE